MADRTKVEPGKRDIFISYSSRDREIARKLKQSVDSLQYTAFFDEVALPGSPEWDRDISRNLGSCRIVLFYRTENSVASEWCARELRLAEQKHKMIVPVVNRSKQSCPPDSEAMEALLVNRQNTFIDELEPPSVIRENLRQTLENCIGKGTGTFGEMSDILNDLLRQTAAAMNMDSQEQGHDREEKSRGSLIQYAYDDEDGAQFYRELTFGNLTAVFRMVCRKGGPPRKWNCGRKNKRCGECPIKELCPKTQSCYVIDTYVQILKGSTKKCDIGPFREALKDLEIGSSKLKLKDCPSKEELLFVRKPLNELSYFDDKDGKKKSESNAFSAVLSLISEAREMFPEIDKALQELRKRADSWNEFLDLFSGDQKLNGNYEIYRDGLIFSLIPRDSSGKKPDPKELGMYDSIKIEKPDPKELGVYDSIEIERPYVIRIRFDSFFSDAKIRFERFEKNKRTTSELLLSSPFLKEPSRPEEGSSEPEGTFSQKEQGEISGGERLMVAIRKKVKKLMAEKVEVRKTWGEEVKIREKFQALIGDLGASFCNWKMTSDHDKEIFTLVGSYRYFAKSPNEVETEIVSPLRLKVVVNRKTMTAGRVLFHVDDANVPVLAAESGGEKAGKKGKPAFCSLEKPGSKAFFQSSFSLKDDKEKSFFDRLDEFMKETKNGWDEIKVFIENSARGRSDTLSALRNGAVEEMEGFCRHQGGVLADLGGDRIDRNVSRPEDGGKRIAWSLRMDHRLYRDFSQLKGAPVPFCPFVQFIGPGMKKWATGWETTRDFRNLPREVKFFFWRVLFGTSGSLEENGNSIFFNEPNDYSRERLGACLQEMKGQKKQISDLWECISGVSDDVRGRLCTILFKKGGNAGQDGADPRPGPEGPAPAAHQEPQPQAGTGAVREDADSDSTGERP